jgi:hypothetical protein
MPILESVEILAVSLSVCGFVGAFLCARRRIAHLTARLHHLEDQSARTERRLKMLESKQLS